MMIRKRIKKRDLIKDIIKSPIFSFSVRLLID
jgi:hypothetical protein